MDKFIEQVITNLANNGFPQKRVSLPLEKMYEVAESKGLNFNTVLDKMESERHIKHQKEADKIIFYLEVPENIQEMIRNLTPEQMAEIQKMYEEMTPEQREEVMKKGRGLFS